ncbi:MAG: transposase [Methylobacter sp.]|nr:transposase [Methylobacter sp.]MDP2427228.1 transposase [Methylobacter sp.]MDP3056026.1 transposase [Methylobacter sp.]MDP3362291.1 transposase [Methylobacter sp.]
MNPGNAKPQLGAAANGTPKNEKAELGLSAPKGWYSRGYLPHLDAPGTLQFITFRLADSLPQTVLKQVEQELLQIPISIRERERRKKIEHWLDAGLGCCALGNRRMAEVMQQTLQIFDGERYRLIAWCIMPNHVHVLIEPTISLPNILQSWKSFTGSWAISHNAELGLGVPRAAGAAKNQFWMREYWDRYIRDEKHFHATVNYIHNNPVKAGLCAEAHDWPWSSAYDGHR